MLTYKLKKLVGKRKSVDLTNSSNNGLGGLGQNLGSLSELGRRVLLDVLGGDSGNAGEELHADNGCRSFRALKGLGSGKLGLGECSGSLLLGNLGSSVLEDLDSLVGDLGNVSGGVSLDGDGKETGITVVVEGSLDGGMGANSGLGQRRGTDGPGHRGRATKEGSESVVDGLGLLDRDGNGDSVASGRSDTDLTTVEGGGAGLLDLGSDGEVGEGGANKLLEILGDDVVTDNGNVSLGVDLGGELLDILEGDGGVALGVDGVSETGSESNLVGSLEGGEGRVSLSLDEVELGHGSHTLGELELLELGLSQDVGKDVNKVGKVLLEELGAQDDVLSRGVAVDLTAEELELSDKSQGRLGHGVLEGELLENVGNTGDIGVSRTTSENHREVGDGGVTVLGGNLDAGGFGGREVSGGSGQTGNTPSHGGSGRQHFVWCVCGFGSELVNCGSWRHVNNLFSKSFKASVLIGCGASGFGLLLGIRPWGETWGGATLRPVPRVHHSQTVVLVRHFLLFSQLNCPVVGSLCPDP